MATIINSNYIKGIESIEILGNTQFAASVREVVSQSQSWDLSNGWLCSSDGSIEIPVYNSNLLKDEALERASAYNVLLNIERWFFAIEGTSYFTEDGEHSF